METTNNWKRVDVDGYPTCDGDTIFIGVNELGFCGCFNQIEFKRAGDRCWYETPEENYIIMSYLKFWKLFEYPNE